MRSQDIEVQGSGHQEVKDVKDGRAWSEGRPGGFFFFSQKYVDNELP